MKKLFPMSVLILVALIAFYQPCVLAQDTAVDETIASILNDVEMEPVAVVAAEPAVENSTETVSDVESAAVEEALGADARAETVNKDVVADADATAETVNKDAVADEEAPTVADATAETADEEAVAEPEVAAPVAFEGVQSELPIQVVNNGHEPSIPDADGVVRVSMDFEQSPLPDVIRAFRDASGANIISGWTNTTPHLVSVRLNNVEWRMGLSAIVASYGLELKEEPRGSSIYVIREKVTVESELPMFTETFELKHARADAISAIFKNTLGLTDLAFDATNAAARAASANRSKSITAAFPSANIVVVKGTEEELESCRAIVAALDVPTRQVYIEARFVRLSSSASKKLGMKWDSLADWGVDVSGLRGGIQVADTKANTFDITTTDARRSKSVSATGATTDSGYTVNKTTSTLIPEKYTGATISGLSVEDLTWKKASGFGGVLSVKDFGLTMSAFEKMDGVQLFSNPRIIVNNETKALVDMTTKVPNVKVTIEDATSEVAGSKLSSSLEIIPGEGPWEGSAFFSYGISLEVTPRVSSTGLITVEIVPSISEVNESYNTTIKSQRIAMRGYKVVGENEYPIIKMQRLITTFTMETGKTAVIGGLTETRESNADSGIPLLRKIPWIGPRLFGWKSREKEQYEIIVFVSVGLADGNTIEQDVGMPKNAVLGRGLLDGTLKEPGDRTDEEMFNLETKTKGYRIK